MASSKIQSRPGDFTVPKGAQYTKYVPQSGGTKVNFPPVGQGPPGVNSTGTKSTSTANSSGMVSGSSKGKGSAGQAKSPPMGNKYKAAHNPY